MLPNFHEVWLPQSTGRSGFFLAPGIFFAELRVREAQTVPARYALLVIRSDGGYVQEVNI